MDREFLGRHRSVNSVSVGLGLSLPVHRSQSTTLKKTDRPPPCWCCSLLRRRHSTPHKKRNERKAGNKKKRPTGVLCIDSVSLPVSLDLRSITLHSTPSLKASLKSTRCHKKLKTKIIPPQAEASLCVNYSSARSLLHPHRAAHRWWGSEREVRGPSWLKLF